MGDGALRGLWTVSGASVARLALTRCGVGGFLERDGPMGETAVLGGVVGRGGEVLPSTGDLLKAPPSERRLSRPAPRWVSDATGIGCGGCENRSASAVVARRACIATGTSPEKSSSSSKTGGPKVRFRGKVAFLEGGD